MLMAALLGALALVAVRPVHAFDDQGLKVLTQKIATKLGSAQKNSIAVVDFVNLEGGSTLLGRFLAEEVANGLGNSERNFEIVDRNHLNSIMKEHKLASTGFIDKLTASTLGNMTGAQALVIGTITPFGDSLRVTVKVLDTKSAKQMVSESVEFPKTKALEEMYDKPLPEAGTSVSAAKTVTKAAPMAAKQTMSETAEEADSSPENVEELEGVSLELVSCDKTGQSVSCHLLAESPTRDLFLDISRGTRIFDENGSEFEVSQAKIANTEGNGHCGHSLVGKTLVAGVRTPVLLVFPNVGTRPRRLSSFEISVDTNKRCSGEHTAHFRNVVLSAGHTSMAKKGGGSAGQLEGGGAESGAGGSLLDEAVDTVKGGMRSLIQNGFDKLKKKAKIPDPPPSDPNKQ
jgi:TolB-like protein